MNRVAIANTKADPTINEIRTVRISLRDEINLKMRTEIQPIFVSYLNLDFWRIHTLKFRFAWVSPSWAQLLRNA